MRRTAALPFLSAAQGEPMRLLLSLSLLLVTVACGGSGSTASPAAPSPTRAPATTSPSASGSGPAILPILVSSEIVAGPNRFLFSLTDRTNNLIAAPDVSVTLEFYDVAVDPNAVALTATARFMWAIENARGLYASDVTFPNAGRWGARFTAAFPDGRTEQVRADFDVAQSGTAFDGISPTTSRVTGLVIDVDQPSLTEVNSFVLRTDAGEELTFALGALDMTDGGFNAGHLREHMATGSKVAVEFTQSGDSRTATRLTDAE